MVVLGGALAVKKFGSRHSTVAIDMLLDPRLGKETSHYKMIHQCIQQVARTQVFGQGWMTAHYRDYFTWEARDKAFHKSVNQSEKPELYCGTNLYVYAMDTEVAFEMKLRRMAEQGRNRAWDLLDATEFLYSFTNGGKRPISLSRCLNLDAGQKKDPIPKGAVGMVRKRFRRVYHELGIVDHVFDRDEGRWKYRDMKGEWVWDP